MLAATVPLPPLVYYARLRGSSLESVEAARRQLCLQPALQDSTFTAVCSTTLHLFKFAPFGPLHFNGLQVEELSSFAPPSSTRSLPNPDKRAAISYFLDAVRCRIIDDMSRGQVRRFKSGILIGHTSPASDWEYKAITRPLIFCHLQVLFSPSHLVVHPTLLPTPFLDISPSLPGTPITLLPFGTPAYFLASYSGPTAGLTKQFKTSLQGLGAGDWDPQFIIAWIKVENKQGEDKGITIIYPSKLCLSYMPYSSSRAPLDYIPELPAPLQPSPQPPSALPSLVAEAIRPSIFTTPTSESLYSFRALTVSKSKDLRSVATEVGGYVDAVARERERERERLKRERENSTGSSPKLTRTPMAVDPVLPPHPPPPPPPPAPPMQTFYPSPPQSAPSIAPEAKTSPVVEPPPPVEPPLSRGSSYDPYSMDASWPQSTDPYLDIDMDFGGLDDMDMNMNFSMPMTTAASTSTYTNTHRANTTSSSAALAFEDAFTDDDFSFFDRPSRPSANTHSRVSSGSHPLALPVGSAIMSPPFGDSAGQMWTPGGLMDGFTPRSMVDSSSSSPGPTPETHASAPSTPNVHLEFDSTKRPGTPGTSTNLFEPIPFAPYHRQADGKYAFGKFALPSPPSEDGSENSPPAFVSLPASPSGFGLRSGWRFRYNAITDPRIGVVKKLIGVKRKTPFSHEHGMRNPPIQTPWIDAHEDWEANTKAVAMEDKADESEDEEDDDDLEGEDTDSPMLSRPTTPPPSYLPLGPTLLATHFQHAHLLPLSTPLRPPGAAITPLNITLSSPTTASNIGMHVHPLPSVPTPVSPAATMGAASEKSRSLEAAAFAIGAEVVENPIWAESWRANNASGSKTIGGVWPADVRAVARLLEGVEGLETGIGMEELFGLEPGPADTKAKPSEQLKALNLQPLEAPMISIGKGEAIIQVLPPALRFWEKLGLGPKGGRKDVSAFVLFEDEGPEKQMLVESWLGGVGTAYQGKHFGTMTPGRSSSCQTDGLLPLRFDSTFRKTLGALVSSLEARHRTAVIFLVLPMTIMTLSSLVLRQILSVSKKILSAYVGCQVIVEFVPEQHIYTALEKPVSTSTSSAYESTLDILSASVYNRILLPVDRLRSRGVPDNDSDVRTYLMAPAFTLCRPWYNKVTYVRAAHTSLDVIDRFTLLHVGYHLTACGKWIIACCVDQRGDNYDLGVWLTQSSPGGGTGEHEGGETMGDEEYAVKKVWDFAMAFARKTNVEWRVVFARLGVLSEKEMNAWTNQLNTNVVSSRQHPPLHHTLLCVVPDAPWYFVPSKSSQAPSTTNPRSTPSRTLSSSVKHQTVFTDISSTTYALFPRKQMSISLPPSSVDLGLSQSFIPEPAAVHSLPPSPHPIPTTPSLELTSSSEVYPHPITLLPQSTSILMRIPHSSSSSSFTSMTQIHLLRTAHSHAYTYSAQSQPLSSSQAPDNQQLMVDVTTNFYELAVLGKARWKLDEGPGGIREKRGVLPFHLAAVDGMRAALDVDWARGDSSVDI